MIERRNRGNGAPLFSAVAGKDAVPQYRNEMRIHPLRAEAVTNDDLTPADSCPDIDHDGTAGSVDPPSPEQMV